MLVEGTSRTDEELGRGRSRGNKTVLFTPPAPEGALVQVRIDSATSQTLRGTAQVAVPA